MIEGVVHDQDGMPLAAYISLASDQDHQDRRGRRAQAGAFRFEGLDTSRRYDVQVDVGCAGMSTALVIYAVAPGGPARDITVPRPRRISGIICDAAGAPVQASVGMQGFFATFAQGSFDLYPVFAGDYTPLFYSERYAPVTRRVLVDTTDVDLGKIMLSDTGIAVQGTVIDERGLPVPNADVYIECDDGTDGHMVLCSKYVRSGVDGAFGIAGLPRQAPMRIEAADGSRHTTTACPPSARDIALGTIILREPAPPDHNGD